MSHRCCSDFSRTEMLRNAAAAAGRALPDPDPRMPTPAGTGLNRRHFLLRSAGVALSVYGATRLRLPMLEEGIAEAAAGPPQPVLVSVFLAGGIDSLSVLAPVGDPLYRKLRPTLALGEAEGTAFSEDGRLRWHPAASGLTALHQEGKVSVMPGVGYDHPDQSHFNSRHFWEVGALNRQLRTGWLGRYLDRTGTGGNPLQGLCFDGRLAPALATSKMPIATVSGRGTFDFDAPGVWGEVEDWMREALANVGYRHAGGRDPALRQAGAVAVQSATLRRQLEPLGAGSGTPPVAYPADEGGDFPQSMAALAAMIAAGLPLRCVALTAYGGYDTHDDQPADLEEGLKAVSDTLLSFQRDLEARGVADRVLLQVWSEFGRRAEENASKGTDHGAAGVGFLVGSRARGTMIGEFPGLDRLDEDGNLRATLDFRSLYCSLLEQWLGTEGSAVIPDAARFPRSPLLK
jgi:uncharacterized protein (DUF1501 family)